MQSIQLTLSQTVSELSERQVSKVLVPPNLFLITPRFFPPSLISPLALISRYPDAQDIIGYFPTSQYRCFKPEAQLLIKKFFSLRVKNPLRVGPFIANVKAYTRARNMEAVFF